MLVISFSYTLGLTVPLAILATVQRTGTTGVAMGKNGCLRTFTRTSAVMFSGANALAGTRPALRSIIPFNRRGRSSLLHLTTYLRRRFPRSVTGTIIHTTTRHGLRRRRMRSGIRCVITRNVTSCIKRGHIMVNDTRFMFRSRGYQVHPRCRRHFSRLPLRCSRLCLTISGMLRTILYVRSPIHRRTGRVVHRLGQRNFAGVIVVANSDRQATTTVTGRVNISRCRTRILPRSGTGFIRRRGRTKHEMIVINSKVGSSPTLSTTSINVTVDSNSRLTQRVTSVAINTSDLRRLICLHHLDGRVVHQVRIGCHTVLNVGNDLVTTNIAKLVRPAASTLLRGAAALTLDLEDVD